MVIEDQHDGTLLCHYIVAHESPYQLSVTLAGAHVRGSPRTVTVRGVRAAECRLIGAAEAAAGAPVEYEMRVLDDDGAALSLSMERQARSHPPARRVLKRHREQHSRLLRGGPRSRGVVPCERLAP